MESSPVNINFSRTPSKKESNSSSSALLRQSSIRVLGGPNEAKTRQSLEYYEDFLKKEPDNRIALWITALDHTSLNEPEKAVEHYDQLLKLNPEDSIAKTWKGLTLQQIPGREKDGRILEDEALAQGEMIACRNTERSVFVEDIPYNTPLWPSLKETLTDSIKDIKRRIADWYYETRTKLM